jgi:hypothetical protein
MVCGNVLMYWGCGMMFMDWMNRSHHRYCSCAFSFFSATILISSLMDFCGSSPFGQVTVHIPMFSHSFSRRPFDNSYNRSSEYWSRESITQR